jgi:hypothetical protein
MNTILIIALTPMRNGIQVWAGSFLRLWEAR